MKRYVIVGAVAGAILIALVAARREAVPLKAARHDDTKDGH